MTGKIYIIIEQEEQAIVGAFLDLNIAKEAVIKYFRKSYDIISSVFYWDYNEENKEHILTNADDLFDYFRIKEIETNNMNLKPMMTL